MRRGLPVAPARTGGSAPAPSPAGPATIIVPAVTPVTVIAVVAVVIGAFPVRALALVPIVGVVRVRPRVRFRVRPGAARG
ncbi:hypothetical protein ACGFWD_10450 [Streptomyces sp. NPDC048448]|uniref:hypothetical protein n=1 Tax=Streptomyces sp. NPDC048448 TaxID=3365554 RepID=UPI003721F581